MAHSEAFPAGKPTFPARRQLQAWFVSHQDRPYPTAQEKEELAERYNMTPKQVGCFFQNLRRRRFLDKLSEEAKAALLGEAYEEEMNVQAARQSELVMRRRSKSSPASRMVGGVGPHGVVHHHAHSSPGIPLPSVSRPPLPLAADERMHHPLPIRMTMDGMPRPAGVQRDEDVPPPLLPAPSPMIMQQPPPPQMPTMPLAMAQQAAAPSFFWQTPDGRIVQVIQAVRPMPQPAAPTPMMGYPPYWAMAAAPQFATAPPPPPPPHSMDHVRPIAYPPQPRATTMAMPMFSQVS